MNDFAAAAMMRLIRLGLARQGLASGGVGSPAAAHVPLKDKRALAEALLQTHGPDALLRIGEAVHDAPNEPTHVALALARDPFDLVSRWQRLERFIHSRHRTRILERDETRLVLRHVALAPHPPPRRAEDLLIFGLLAALVEYVGAEDFRARIAGETVWRRRGGTWKGGACPDDVSRWEFAWTSVRRIAPVSDTAPIPGDWAAAARAALAADPGRGWTLRQLADALRVSTRSLQRRLKTEGTSFSYLLAEARLAAAATLLGTSDRSAAEIGYACGFADQPHFTRDFKRHTALTPTAFRAQFAQARRPASFASAAS